MSFAADVQSWGRKTSTELSETLTQVVEELFGAIIRETPIATGLARSNWQTTTGSPATGVAPNRGETAALAEVSAAVTYVRDTGGSVFLRNNLPYIGRLEYGYSNQAPTGMVRRNVAKFRRLVYWRKRGGG